MPIILSEKDKAIVRTNGKQLEDTHIDAFSNILTRQSNFVPQSTLFVQIPSMIKSISQGQKHIQILHTQMSSKIGHWTCTYYDGESVFVYDSLNRGNLNTDEDAYLRRLYPFSPVRKFPKVQNQPNNDDCGIFAIAFATSVHFGQFPNMVSYNHSQMRPHLLKMYESDCLIPFPTREICDTSKQKQVAQNKNTNDQVENVIHVPKNITVLETENEINKLEKESNITKLKLASPSSFRKHTTQIREVVRKRRIEDETESHKKNRLERNAVNARKRRLESKLKNEKLISVNDETIPKISEIETASKLYLKNLQEVESENEVVVKKQMQNSETEVQKIDRLKKNAFNKKQKRNSESEVKIRDRINKISYANKKKIESESEVEKQNRLNKKSTANKKRIELESELDKQSRLDKMSTANKKRIQLESELDKQSRLGKISTGNKKRIKLESELDKQSRLDKMSTAYKKRIELESELDKQSRLDKMSTANKKRIELESELDKQSRLDKMSTANKKRIELESELEKENRIKTIIITKNKKIELESNLQKKDRLTKKSKVNQSNYLKKKESNKNPCSAFIVDNINEDTIESNFLGDMNVQCELCHSLNFIQERPQDKKFNNCCHKGKVDLPKLTPYPKLLFELNTKNEVENRNFRENIRSYNSSLAFASIGAQLEVLPGRGPFVYRIHGQIYHNTYSLHPNQDEIRKYGQLYIIDTEEALNTRMIKKPNKTCLREILLELDILIRSINPFAQAFKMLRELELEEEIHASLENRTMRNVQMWIKQSRELDKNRFNIPKCNEVAVVFVSEDGEPPIKRDICIHPKNDESVTISSLSPNVDPMSYPLLFPSGDPGWTVNIKHTSGCRNVTPLQYYSYRLSIREEYNPYLYSGKLTQQFIVDIWSKIEGERLKFIKQEQNKLRVELYSGLMDYIENKAQMKNINPGRIVILPSSFTGGPRAYQQSFMDGMSLVQKFGTPQLFITMTCNPCWSEITNNLKFEQKASDRPDLIARVFQQKVNAIKQELIKNGIFGEHCAHIYVIEFQKRGLPHMHMLLFLTKEYIIHDAETVDKIVSTEIPDETTHPKLYEIVKRTMIHGPCGNQNKDSPCMDKEKNICTKSYPKKFIEETHYNNNGYPLYRRRNNNRSIKFYKKDGSIKSVADNRFVVPFNPYLSLKYNCHINVEVCSTIQCIKYLFKYCYKGHDCAVIEIANGNSELQHDEVAKYISTRYVCPPEAMHRLLEYKIHEQSHTTYRLAVHLDKQQPVYFKEGKEEIAINQLKNTMLTAWFELNRNDPEAHQYLYTEIPLHYIFVESNKTWKPRKQITKPIICRMYFVSPKDLERYYCRLLLLHVRGAKSFEDVRTYEGIVYEKYTDAVRARNLIADDTEWDNCLAEGSTLKFPKHLCQLFAYICVFGLPHNALSLWEKYKEMFYELNIEKKLAEQRALQHINDILCVHGYSLKDFRLPMIQQEILDSNGVLDLELLRGEAENLKCSLNNDQRNIFDTIMTAVYDDECSNRYIFIDGPGGSGKSFLHNTTISFLNCEQIPILAVAWTGIAANLLQNGRTVHSTFKLPIPLTEISVSGITGCSKSALLIKKAKVIIWDEISMVPTHAFRAVESLLRDITKCDKPFGGKVIILSDFRQTLPIVRHGSRTQIIENCIKNNKLWQLFKRMPLQVNIRVSNNDEEFSNWLLQVGNGKWNSVYERNNEVTEICNTLLTGDDLIDKIFGNTIDPMDRSIMSCVILSPTNVQVLNHNNIILERLEGDSKTYFSVDTNNCEKNDEIQNIIPVEFMNNLTPGGLPPHKLKLKVGAIVILLRNLNVNGGLCNGSRLIISKMMNNLIEVEILTGKRCGEKVLIPRIDLTPAPGELAFNMKRRQFPLRLAYAMTINKAQGQSFNKVGVNLPNRVFGHGQLYVALSRVKSKEGLKICIQGNAVHEYKNKMYTKNIVYHDVL